MFSERIDSINENKSIFLLENNETYSYNGNFFINLININNNLNIEEDNDPKDTSKNKFIPPYYYINKKEEDNKNIKEGISAELRVKKDKNSYNTYDTRYDFLNKIVENNEGNAPFLYSFDNILNIFKKKENKNKFKDIYNKYSNNEGIKDDNLVLEKKRKRDLERDKELKDELLAQGKQNDKIKKNRKIKIILDNKRGRKTKEIKDIGIHNKMVPDNIIKKIKAKIFEYSLVFLNNILDNSKAEDKLFKIDYKFINRLNREQDLKFLDMSLKELFSKDISPKYITNKRQKDFNKKYINTILKNTKDNTILFAFNITFRDWLDLFTLKKNIKEILFEYDYLDKDIDYERIQKSLYDVENLLNKIMIGNDKEYLTMFIFLPYNYERWFYKKKVEKQR